MQNLIFNYAIDCDNQTFNSESDSLSWNVLFIDQTAVGENQITYFVKVKVYRKKDQIFEKC